VIDFAHEVAERSKHPRLRDRTVDMPPGVDASSFASAARRDVAAEARGLIAPMKCVEAVLASLASPFAEGMQIERAFFVELLNGSESKALRHAFFAERAAAKIPDVPDNTPTRPIRNAAVIGFGTMGGGIAMSLANAGIRCACSKQSRRHSTAASLSAGATGKRAQKRQADSGAGRDSGGTAAPRAEIRGAA